MHAKSTEGGDRTEDVSLGDLLEGIVLHVFEGKVPFSPQTLKDIEQFRSLYGLTLKAEDSHHLREKLPRKRLKA